MGGIEVISTLSRLVQSAADNTQADPQDEYDRVFNNYIKLFVLVVSFFYIY